MLLVHHPPFSSAQEFGSGLAVFDALEKRLPAGWGSLRVLRIPIVEWYLHINKQGYDMSSRADGFNLVLFVPEQLDLFERNNGFALEAAAGFGNVAWWQVTEMHNVCGV